MLNFLRLLRRWMGSCDFLAVASMGWDQEKVLVIFTSRFLKLLATFISAPLIQTGVCVPPCFMKSMPSSFEICWKCGRGWFYFMQLSSPSRTCTPSHHCLRYSWLWWINIQHQWSCIMSIIRSWACSFAGHWFWALSWRMFYQLSLLIVDYGSRNQGSCTEMRTEVLGPGVWRWVWLELGYWRQSYG